MVDESRIEIPADRGQVPGGEQGGDELVDDLLAGLHHGNEQLAPGWCAETLAIGPCC